MEGKGYLNQGGPCTVTFENNDKGTAQEIHVNHFTSIKKGKNEAVIIQ